MNSRSLSPSRSKFDRRKTQKASKITKKIIKLDDFINALTDEQFDDAQQRHKLKYFRSRIKGKTFKNRMQPSTEDDYDLHVYRYDRVPSNSSSLSRVSTESLDRDSYSDHESRNTDVEDDLHIISNSTTPKWKLEEDIVYSPKVRFGGVGIKRRNVKKRNTKKRNNTKKRKMAKKH